MTATVNEPIAAAPIAEEAVATKETASLPADEIVAPAPTDISKPVCRARAPRQPASSSRPEPRTACGAAAPERSPWASPAARPARVLRPRPPDICQICSLR